MSIIKDYKDGAKNKTMLKMLILPSRRMKSLSQIHVVIDQLPEQRKNILLLSIDGLTVQENCRSTEYQHQHGKNAKEKSLRVSQRKFKTKFTSHIHSGNIKVKKLL